MRARLLVLVVLLVPAIGLMGVPSALADETPTTSATSASAISTTSEAAPTDAASSPTDAATDGASGTATTTDAATSAVPTTGSTTPPSDSVGNVEITGGSDATTSVPQVLAAAAGRHDPRASIGNVDCELFTVPVTLDNTRSTGPTTFFVLAGDFGAPNPAYDESFTVAAGVTQVVLVPVTEDTQITVEVGDEAAPQGTPLAFAFIRVNCRPNDTTQDPQASIGDVDCTAMTVPVTLDNSRSANSTTFVVTADDISSGESAYNQTFVVEGDDSRVVQIPVREDTSLLIGVGDNVVFDATQGSSGGLAAELVNVDCTPGTGPGATIGQVSCSTLTVPVTLDNTGSPTVTDFVVLSGETSVAQASYDETFTVAAGATRIVQVPVANHAEVAVLVADDSSDGPPLAEKVLTVACAPAAAPIPQLPRTGGFNLAVPLIGLAFLGGGALLVASSRPGRKGAHRRSVAG